MGEGVEAATVQRDECDKGEEDEDLGLDLEWTGLVEEGWWKCGASLEYLTLPPLFV